MNGLELGLPSRFSRKPPAVFRDRFRPPVFCFLRKRVKFVILILWNRVKIQLQTPTVCWSSQRNLKESNCKNSRQVTFVVGFINDQTWSQCSRKFVLLSQNVTNFETTSSRPSLLKNQNHKNLYNLPFFSSRKVGISGFTNFSALVFKFVYEQINT